MADRMSPFRTTVIFGLVCALLFIPLRMLFGTTGFWPIIFRLAIFGCIAVYALLLTRWGNQRRRAGRIFRPPHGHYLGVGHPALFPDPVALFYFYGGSR